MNSSIPTIMTVFDHRAAALELNLAYGYMVRFERLCQRGSRLPARVKTAMERIYLTIHELHQEMRQVQERTQAVDPRRSTCWEEPEEPRPTPILRKRGAIMTLDDHAAAARELGQAQRADLRFLRIVSDRRQVPVRILDMSLEIENRIHAICCAMDDLQFLTLRGEERNVAVLAGPLQSLRWSRGWRFGPADFGGMEMKNDYVNDPRCLQDLPADQQDVLIGWIRDVLVPARRAFHRTSYGMKHDFESEPGGFYVTNGMFKGAILAAGYQPVDTSEINWRFRVRPVRELDDHEKTSMRVIGRGWLARDSPQRRGYAVVKRGDRKRIDAWCRACYGEKRPMVRVEVCGHCATVVMDMIAADWKLSLDAMNEVAQLFSLVDPKGKNWWNINGCYNYIRSVPVDVAEAIAARVVIIADACRPPAPPS